MRSRENDSRVSGLPRGLRNRRVDLSGVQLSCWFTIARVDEGVVRALGRLLHPPFGHSDRDVEVGDSSLILGVDELHDVGVGHVENSHVGATAE